MQGQQEEWRPRNAQKMAAAFTRWGIGVLLHCTAAMLSVLTAVELSRATPRLVVSVTSTSITSMPLPDGSRGCSGAAEVAFGKGVKGA